MFGLLKFLLAVCRTFYELLDPNLNAMRNAPASIKYGASVLLACLWCLAFGLYVGELTLIGYNMFGHIAIISMAFFTWLVVKTVTKQYPVRNQYEILRDPGRAPKCYDMTEEEKLVALQQIDSKLDKPGFDRIQQRTP